MRKHAYKVRLAAAGIILLLAIYAVWGVYPFKIFDVQFGAMLQRALLSVKYKDIALLCIVLLSAIAFGRFYCSIVCPLGSFQEFAALLIRGKKKNSKTGNFPVKHFISALALGAVFAGSAVLLRHIDPYTIFGSAASLSVFGLIFILCLLILVFFKNRFFCTNICPIGALLGTCSRNASRTMNIDADKCISCRMCEKNCPAGCIDIDNKKIDNETCLKCLKCYSICPKEAVYYGYKKPEFDASRRRTIIGASALALFAASYAAGMKFTKELAAKVKNIILPPGAKNASRMINKCLNCNLCIKNCPSGILVPADKDFGAVHIDYTKGSQSCAYTCHNCAEVCPSGAVKRMTLEEKQNTRIAMASVQTEKCSGCGACIPICPKDALSKNEAGAVFVDGSKCIGCGNCASICAEKAIEIFGIKEQTAV